MVETKYFIIVRLFAGWELQLDSLTDLIKVYRSMRVDIFPDTGWEYVKYKYLNEEIDFNNPFDVLCKTNLTRDEMLELNSRLHTAIYPDNSDDSSELTYNSWMEGYKNAINELQPLI